MAGLAERYLQGHAAVNCRAATLASYRYKLGRVLKARESDGSANPSATAALRLLILTGCRRNKIVRLRWDDMDRAARELRQSAAKTGARTVPLAPAVEAVLRGIDRDGDSPWVIAGRNANSHMVNVDAVRKHVCAKAGLKDVRIQNLRHFWASRALALGESLPAIGKLLGHAHVQITARYAHPARDATHEAAAQVADSIAGDIL